MRPDDFRGAFRDDEEARAVYSEAAGIGRLIPRAVAVPADAADVVTLVRWACANGTPLVARGCGTSMANGALGEGVIVDLRQLEAIARPEFEARRITCGPGAIRDAVDAAARHGALAFPVDPSSGAFCTIGGMCATNAAGSRTVKFGPMRRWVHGLECVFADGSRAWIRRGEPAPAGVVAVERFLDDVAPRLDAARASLVHHGVKKESSGYALGEFLASHDLVDLLVGSEGTLALFTGIELGLVPAPAFTASVLAAFDHLGTAAPVATDCAALGASAVELLDRTFLDVLRAGGAAAAFPASTDAVLLIEVEGASRSVAAEAMRAVTDRCRTAGAAHLEQAQSDAAETALWAIRHAASPILTRLDPNLASMQLVEDGAIPPARFAEYVHGVRSIFARHHLRCVIFGHAGDAHVHVNALVDVREPDWRARATAVLGDVTALVAGLGGTIAAEHGDGRLRTPLLGQLWDRKAMALFAATKRAFDPTGILNPGVKVALPLQDPFGDVKYDPTLPPLPARAREVLDAVVRDSGWARPRLAMLER